MGNLHAPSAHAELVAFANRLAAESKELGENTFGVKLLADRWMIAGLELTAGQGFA